MASRGRRTPREGAGLLPAPLIERVSYPMGYLPLGRNVSPRERRAERRRGPDMHLSMKSLVVIALVVLLLALAVLVVPSHSWAAAYEWFINAPGPPCACLKTLR
jgi:hypothetical protein